MNSQEQNELMTMVLAGLGDGVILTDSAGRILFLNAEAARLTGHSQEESLGTEISGMLNIIEEQSWGATPIPIAEVLRSRRRLEFGSRSTLVSKSGRSVSIAGSIAPVRKPGGTMFPGAVLVFRESGRERVSEALQPAHDPWDSIVDIVPDLISIHDTDYRIVRVNRAMAERLGKTTGECIGRECYTCAHGLDGPPDYCPHTQTCRDGQTHQVRVREPRLGGEFLITTKPLWDGTGDLIGSVHVAQDISDLKRAEDRIGELNERLAAGAGELAAANAEFDAFSCSVSHDLRAPLRQMNAFAGLLRDAASADLNSESLDYLTLIQRAAGRMTQLIDDLLALSRIGRAELKRGEVNLRDLIDQAQHTLRPTAKDRLVNWEIAALPAVCGDPDLLRRVIMNLLDNALKFTRGRDRAEIEIGCLSGAKEHTFFVRDNGIGFDSASAEKLFGPFQRFHSPNDFEGTGIGLAIVRRIIHRHGGRAWAESALDRGTTIYFTLPRGA